MFCYLNLPFVWLSKSVAFLVCLSPVVLRHDARLTLNIWEIRPQRFNGSNALDSLIIVSYQ